MVSRRLLLIVAYTATIFFSSATVSSLHSATSSQSDQPSPAAVSLSSLSRKLSPELVNQLKADAERGDAASQFELGLRHNFGHGLKQDSNRAEHYYQLAATQGHTQAQFNLGQLYSDKRSSTHDDSKAAYFYRQAADNGHAQAQFFLGLLHTEGKSVSQDDTRAAYYYRLAAAQGLMKAQYYLGLMYAEGKGIEQSDVKAAYYYRLAADQGLADAQYLLGLRYQDGRGVTRDYSRAAYYHQLAAGQGHDKARALLSKSGMVKRWQSGQAMTLTVSGAFVASASLSRAGERRLYFGYSDREQCVSGKTPATWHYNNTPVIMQVTCFGDNIIATPLSDKGHQFLINLFKRSSEDIRVKIAGLDHFVKFSAMGFTKTWESLNSSTL